MQIVVKLYLSASRLWLVKVLFFPFIQLKFHLLQLSVFVLIDPWSYCLVSSAFNCRSLYSRPIHLVLYVFVSFYKLLTGQIFLHKSLLRLLVHVDAPNKEDEILLITIAVSKMIICCLLNILCTQFPAYYCSTGIAPLEYADGYTLI